MVTMVVGSLQSHKQQYATDIGNLIFPIWSMVTKKTGVDYIVVQFMFTSLIQLM